VALPTADVGAAELFDRAGALAIAGDIAGATDQYRELLARDPDHAAARRYLAVLLIRTGRTWESLEHWRALSDRAHGGRPPIELAVERAMRVGDLALAAEMAKVVAAIGFGSECYPQLGVSGVPPAAIAGRVVTAEKLHHDAEQLEHLATVIGRESAFEQLGERFRQAAADLERRRVRRVDLYEYPAVGDEYGRILHMGAGGCVEAALGDWETAEVERDLAQRHPPVAVIDDFLTADALATLRSFCWESTIWNTNRYHDGRLAAFFTTGFNCPLLVQIAHELRQRFAAVLRRDHTLRQIWAFKYPSTLDPGRSLHADFAGVNVNFWITPDDACLTPGGGGLTVYDV
jgi:hypothetical protein